MEGNRHLGLLIVILFRNLQESVAIDAPAIVALENEGSTDSLKVTWTPPADATAHVVTWSQPDGSGSDTSGDLSGTVAEYIITGLTSGTLYNLTVTAQNGTGDTNDDSGQGRTIPNPVVLTESVSTVDSVSATWIKPAGEVTSYDVQCSSGTVVPPPVQSGDGPFSASCTDLPTPGEEYTMNVTSLSNGQRSDVATIALRALPEAVTLNEESNMVTSTTITASWTMPKGIVEYYEVSCSKGTASPAQINPSDDLIASCTGLSTPGDNYAISVTSVSNGQRSATSTITITALPSAVSLSEGPSNNTAISATWTIPDSVVDTFYFSCSAGTASPMSIPVEFSPTSDTFTAYCIGLPTPGLEYDLSVVAISNGKLSAVQTVGVHALPTGMDLTEGSPTTDSVSVNWMQPVSAVESYSISCSSGVASPATIEDTTQPSYMASCVNLAVPGDTYTMTVYSIVDSGATTTSSSIDLVALPEAVTLNEESYMVTTTSITASWTMPNGRVEYYEVNCSYGTTSPAQVNPSDDLEASCTGLSTPGDNYIIVVASVSNGKLSATSTITITALPEAVTLNEESNMVTTTTITASWTVPNGIVEYYEVSCSDGTASPAQVDPSDDLIASCSGLSTPGDDYSIAVTAVSNGQRSAASAIIITALPEAVELSPGESNITAISATWTVPNSVVDTFNITCSSGTASPASIPAISSQAGQQLTAYCVGLPKSGEQYDLSVVAISNDKLSAIITIEVFALPLGVALEEGPSTLTSVSASWMRQNEPVESYSITCSHGGASPSTIEDTDQESFSAACVNLTGPGATYRMIVFSEVGTESSSNGTRASSLINLVAVPESVESISVTQYATTTVDAQWHLTQCSNCIYNYFLLTFEPDSQQPIRVDYTTGVNEYSSQVSGLTQGRSYSFTVVSVSGVGVEGATLKTSEEKSVDQRTVPATPFGLSILSSQRELNLVWGYLGDADDFTITITPDDGIAMFNGNFTQPAADVTDLIPGTTYDIAIVTVSGDERSEPITETATTLADKPSPVLNPEAEAVDKNTITLTYERPAEPNGEIESFMISYVGTREGNPNHEFSDAYGVVLTVTYDDLYPGFSYIFTIIAVNDGPFESVPVSTEPVETPQEEPPPVEEDYPYEANTVVSATSTTSFSVVLPEDLFSHDNGELSTFAVIITREANDATVGSTELTYDEARAQNGNMPAYITAIDIPYPFPSQFGSNRKRRATESSATVVIGDGTCSGSPKEYCNKGLDDNTQYYYVFRAYNGRGYGTSGTFGPVTTVKDNTAAIAAGVSVSLIIIIVAVVVVAVFLKRRQPNEPSPRPSLEGRENQGYDGPDQEMRPTRRKTGGSMHRKSHSKPIVLNKFEGHYGRMKADSDFRFTEEYDEIRQVGKDQAIVAATEMVNRAKNRFTNILPYEHSRVKLAALADDPDTDYINANYIPGYNSPREFMACQGPLPGTVDDMWRMIWEKKTSIIVMLTQLVEKGKIKCHEYWPADYNPVTYGSIQVSIQALQQYDHWVIREFSVSQGDEIRKLTQYHFMSWPDHGVPDKTWTMLDFVRTVREAIQKVGSDRPIVAHCSAGVGRTGTYIALDRLMQAMQENDYIDIFGIICEMRMQRNHMVQTEKQYIFIHECVMDLLRRGEEEDTGESIYVNLPSNGFKDPDDVNKNLLDQAV